MSAGFYRALTPWLIYAVADRSAGLKPEGAALVATAAALTVCGYDARLRRAHSLSVFSVFAFSAIAVVAITTGNPGSLQPDGRAIAFAALALYLIVSLLREPATLRYASETHTPRSSSNPSFRRHHIRLTRQWSLVVAMIALSYTAGALLHGRVPATLFNWFIPIALAVTVISRSKAPARSSAEEAIVVRHALDSLLSHPGKSWHTETSPARGTLRLLPQRSFHPSPRAQARRSEL